jgi:hypothetical protein
VNRREGHRHRFAADLLARIGRDLIVPWPVLVELDLLLRTRGHVGASIAMARSCLEGIARRRAWSLLVEEHELPEP